jgi:carbamoyl-phosphate synthase large subunit
MTTHQSANIATVAVTGLHRGNNPQPGAAVVTSLRRRFPKLRIVGLSYDPMESSIYSRGADHLNAAYLLPYPHAGAAALLDRLEMVMAKEDISYIIPCLDSEILNFIQIQPELIKRGIKSVLPTKKSFNERNKAGLFAFCQRLGIPAPETRVADDVQAAADFAQELGYPVYVKGKYYGAYLVNSDLELRSAANDLIREWGTPVIVQEPLHGEEYDLVGLGDGNGTILGSCGIRKMMLTSAGKGFAGVVIADPRLDGLARRIIHALRWNGPFELEFIKPAGKPHVLFEMNPRFPAWTDFPSQMDCNFPARLFECLTGITTTPLADCPAGQMFIRHSIDLLGDIADLAKMASTGERIDSLIL